MGLFGGGVDVYFISYIIDREEWHHRNQNSAQVRTASIHILGCMDRCKKFTTR